MGYQDQRVSDGVNDTEWFGDSEDERLLNAQAAALYADLTSRELGLPCRATWIVECGIPFNVVHIAVPAGVQRPHRVYHSALNRVHDAVATVNPELLGRITFSFDQVPDAG